jgi:type I restriction enzyme S subunit
LSLIDERISTQSKIIEGLKELKASLNKQIFSRRLRFKDENGNDFPEWVEKSLGEVGEIIGGGTPDTNTPEYWDGDINWFVPSEIGKQKYISSSVRTISHIGLKNSSAKLLRDGTILLSTRATIGEKSILNGVGCTNQGFQSISVNNENINVFIYYLLDKYKVDMIKNASGSTFLEISSSNLKKIKVFVPSFLEQQKIASILSAIDEKIEIEKEILEEYTAQKKHLLKQMFI